MSHPWIRSKNYPSGPRYGPLLNTMKHFLATASLLLPACVAAGEPQPSELDKLADTAPPVPAEEVELALGAVGQQVGYTRFEMLALEVRAVELPLDALNDLYPGDAMVHGFQYGATVAVQAGGLCENVGPNGLTKGYALAHEITHVVLGPVHDEEFNRVALGAWRWMQVAACE